MLKTRLPLRSGMTVGLLGGSFDPAHEGHAHLTRVALKRFGLARVIWLVTPGNPLKTRGPASIELRILRARLVMQDRRVLISDFERQAGTRYTAETIEALQKAYPGVKFVWLMGADNLQQFHKWERWQDIIHAAPIGALARPGYRQTALHSQAARQYRHNRIPGRASQLLPHMDAPKWCFVNMPMMPVSSSEIRATGAWRAV